MHSRIYQISENLIQEENLITEGRYSMEGFIGRIADYVVPVDSLPNIKSDLEWLENATRGIEVDTEANTIKITSKKEYFEENFENFKKLTEKLNSISLEDFTETGVSISISTLCNLHENKRGFYIDDNDEYLGTVPFDTWVRHAEENKIYYVGSIFNYHF